MVARGAADTSPGQAASAPALELDDVTRRFGVVVALAGVSLSVRAGEVHALLGPNGAGKTTLLRIMSGLVEPDDGELRFHGAPARTISPRRRRRMLGLVPSGDRSFYLRISGLENLVFFARLHGLAFAQATERSWECLRAVGLDGAAKGPVGTYSHGMQKRLSVARALLMDPSILLLDEATHDLDPQGAHTVRELVAASAARGAAVLWTSQRVEEIRSFADRVTLLNRGTVRFAGTVPDLMAASEQPRYLLRLHGGANGRMLRDARAALRGLGTLRSTRGGEAEHYMLQLNKRVTVGDAVASLVGSGIQVLACHEERSGIEAAFLHLTEGADR